MGIAMISTIIYTVPMMVEIAVDIMSIHNTAQYVYALKIIMLHWSAMVSVTMRPTIQSATMMVGIAVL